MQIVDETDNRRQEKKPASVQKALAAVGGSLTAAGLTLLFGSFLMRLWNRIMHRFFGLPAAKARDAYELRVLIDVLTRLRAGQNLRRRPRTQAVPAAAGLPGGREPYYAQKSARPPEWPHLSGSAALKPSLN